MCFGIPLLYICLLINRIASYDPLQGIAAHRHTYMYNVHSYINIKTQKHIAYIKFIAPFMQYLNAASHKIEKWSIKSLQNTLQYQFPCKRFYILWHSARVTRSQFPHFLLALTYILYYSRTEFMSMTTMLLLHSVTACVRWTIITYVYLEFFFFWVFCFVANELNEKMVEHFYPCQEFISWK